MSLGHKERRMLFWFIYRIKMFNWTMPWQIDRNSYSNSTFNSCVNLGTSFTCTCYLFKDGLCWYAYVVDIQKRVLYLGNYFILKFL